MQENIYRVYFITFIRAERDTHAFKAFFPPCLEPTLKISSIQTGFACLLLNKLKQAQVQIDC